MTSLALALVLAGAPPEPLFRDGDRVVFLGDSITVLHTWTRLVELSVRLRHPQWTMTFINAGVGGNTAEDALARLDVDVLSQRPDVVFVNFGMNDASYPEGSSGAAFEKNMTALLDRLQAAKVRRVVWLDTTPYDTTVGAGNAFNRRRVARIAELLEFSKKTAAERALPLVPVNDAVTRALMGWKTAKRAENLMPDRIHPGPALHGVMAAEVLATTGFDVGPARVKVTVRDGTAVVNGGDGGVPWTGDGPLVLDLSRAPPPLPFVLPLADAKALDSKALLSLGSLQLAVSGLVPKQRYVVRAGTLEVGRFSGAQLAAGVDLMQSAPARVAPGPERADLSSCDAVEGNPWANDVSCLFNLLFGKDQLRITMRHEKTRGLPDSVPGYLERLFLLQREWVEAVDRDVEQRVRALVARPHLVSIEPEPARDGG
ncbi:MAG: SGNH/GDSL hydrolase family protein [Myxococcaceae bacterium]|nr:SGNH/GDSL hydrolase family protein [Myxococcaceae bacterium]